MSSEKQQVSSAENYHNDFDGKKIKLENGQQLLMSASSEAYSVEGFSRNNALMKLFEEEFPINLNPQLSGFLSHFKA